MLAAIAVICTILCSCSKENKENTTPEKKTYFGELQFELTTTPETLASFDFYVMEYTANGEVSKHNVTKWEDKSSDLFGAVKRWNVETKISLPGKLGLYVELVPKSGLDMEAKYTIMYDYLCLSWSVDSNGQDMTEAFRQQTSKYERNRAGTLDAVLQMHNPLVNAVLTFDADGKCTVSKWE